MTNYDRQRRNTPKPGNNPKPTDPNGPQSPGASTGPSYLNERQQARVDKLLGANYDPTKPLNVQLFKARWAEATPQERRVIAKELSGDFVEGVKFKSLSGFHTQYLDALAEENKMLQLTLQDHVDNYTQNGGGYATTQAEMDSNLAYWTQFASTPEGQAHIAATGQTPEDWLAGQAASLQAGVDNYTQQQKQYGQIASLSQRLGQAVPGFKPPGWESTSAAIQAGHAPLPGALTMSMYPGVASDIAGIDPALYKMQSNKERMNGPADSAAGGLYQPFTNFTGTQYPDTFSERDLFQETQAR